MTRRASLTLTLLLLLVGGGGAYTWWWFRLAEGIRDGVHRWAEERRGQGWRVSFAAIETGGFPGPVRVRIEQPRLTRPDGLDWQTAALRAEISPLNPLRVEIDAAGRHDVAMPPATALVIDAAKAQTALLLDGSGRLDRLDFAGSGISTGAVGGEAVRAETLRLQLDPMPHAGEADHLVTSLAVDAAAEGLLLPASAKAALGPRVGVVSMSGRIQGALPPEPLTTALTRWRDDGGTAELDRVALDWGPLRLTGNGTLALDGNLQPQLAMSTAIRGFDETLDQLSRDGILRAKDAGTAKMILGLMAKPQADGTAPVIEVPLTIQDGVLYLGPAALAKVPAIAWPAPEAPR